jgi:hypothetical protein
MMSGKTSGGWVLLFCAVLAGCGNRSGEPQKSASAPPVEYFHPDPSTVATAHGKITFHGQKPPRKAISMDADQGCANANQGKTVYQEQVVTGKSGERVRLYQGGTGR